MDEDLAFCLDQFIDDQVKLIDECIRKIEEQEAIKRSEIDKEETSPAFIEERRAKEAKKGTHAEDKSIVDRFSRDLHESSLIDPPSSTTDSTDTTRESLRAELATKISACSTYIGRLRNVAKGKPNSAPFIQRYNEVVDLLRRGQGFDDNYTKLCDIIAQSNMSNCVQNVHQWWKETYGYIITEINQQNAKFNPAIVEKNFAILSPTSRIIQHTKTIVEKQKPSVPKRIQKYDVIHEFVRQIQTIDEENRREINVDNLVDQLEKNDTKINIDYAQTWLKKRDEIRERKEENSCEVRWQAAKAEFRRQKIAQESKKLGLVVLVRRLAIGSSNTEHFDQNLMKTIAQQQQGEGQSLPVITGDIKDPNAEELSFSIKLTNVDINQLSTSINCRPMSMEFEINWVLHFV